MKRSEMVEILTRVILNDRTEFRLVQEEADLILKAIEAAGMTPPTYTGVIASGKKYNHEEDFARDTALFTEWEPED